MLRNLLTPRAPVVAGVVTLALSILAAGLMPSTWRDTLRENSFDLTLAAAEFLRPKTTNQASPPVVVIDIDRRSVEVLGAWPWPHDRMARLLEAVAVAKPAVMAVDILFAEIDSRSPAALARQLAGVTGRADLLTLADGLPDGDKRLAEALKASPAVLGFVLDPDQAKSIDRVPIMTRGQLSFEMLWRTPGAVGPVTELEQAAAGLGALSLPGDADSFVRRVPLLVGAADTLHPGLALETMRVNQRALSYLIQADPPALTIGALVVPWPRDGMLRLVPVAMDQWMAQTISAIDLIEGRADAKRIAGAVALVGGSAPELGGLRQTFSDSLMPSVQIQAAAVRQIGAGRVPRPFDAAGVATLLLAIALGLIAIAVGAALHPIIGAAVMLTVILLTWMTALGLSFYADRLLDALTPALAAMLAFMATSITAYAGSRRREALVRRSFEQHLAPAVVRRIVEQPTLMKLKGERRDVTALFADIEDFTAMMRRADPESLVAALDDYFEGAAAIIIEHGGMIDKIVGDAIHALFNVPIDLKDHPKRAVDCAIALRDWAEHYRRGAAPAALGFGRTRIGIETGSAIVGDVGIRAKLDYTAHGDAINTAARLEAANKDLGSTICVGPSAAACCDPVLLRPLGQIAVRGRDDVLTVFEPWPPDASASWREGYLAALNCIAAAPAIAAEHLDRLAAERPDDPVPRLLAQRLRAPSVLENKGSAVE